MPHASESSAIAPKPLSRYRRARRYTYDLLLTPEVDSQLERFVRAGLSILILANILMVVLETIPAIRRQFGPAFYLFEVFSVAVFSLEYVLRLWAAVEEPRYARALWGRLRYALTPLALVDLLAVLPFYVPQLIHADMRFLRGLRLVRLARVFKLGRYSTSLALYTSILREKREELVTSLVLLCLLLLMSSSLMYFVEHSAQPNDFSSIPAAMWWGIITLTTIGYGDTYPVTTAGKVLGAVIAVIGVGFVALPSAILVGGMMEQMELRRKSRSAASAEDHAQDASVAGPPAAPQPCPHCGRYPDEKSSG
ncbi:MAG: ion transporter [Deltaproteobacteria bacterium]|nr:ion transporter [Deltaproteobacteria bacterium]